jgi:CO/xanthine dehydrogenase Mo-binding subunit
MAKHTGRGYSAIEYPTGMNQNGDPSQAWIKIKPDGRVDVFSGTADIGNGSKTIQTQIVAETLGVPYDWITYDNSNTDSSPLCTGTFASRATFVAGNAVRKAALNAREKLLEIAGKELEIDPADPETGQVDIPPHSAISYAACAAEVEVDDETGEVLVKQLWQCFDVGRAINPTLVEGQIEGGAIQGLGLAVLENCYPYYPSVEHRGGEFGSYPAPGIENLPKVTTILIENPSADGPYGAKGISEMANNPQPPAIAAAVYDAVGVWVTELPITPERVLKALHRNAAGEAGPQRKGKVVRFDEELSVSAVAHEDSRFRFEVPA